MKNLYILGAAGSIGTQTLDIIRKFPNRFNLIGASLSSKDDINEAILSGFDLEVCVLRNNKLLKYYQNKYPNTLFYYGDEGLIKLAQYKKRGLFLNALSGSSGLIPTIEAIKAKKTILLANKETLVMAGNIINEYLLKYDVKLYPIDSEHNALWQLLDNVNKKHIEKIIITASGGSFRNKNRSELKNVTRDEALNHPNWQMGSKITIDSATMMNKGLEVIEAHYLFNLPYEKIETILHEESLVHGILVLKDGNIKAMLGNNDMRNPILYALMYPNRAESSFKDFKFQDLHFKEMDFNRYPLLKLAYDVGKKGGLLPTVMNAANEAAVNLFLNNKITFLQIEEIVINNVLNFKNVKNPSLSAIIECDKRIKNEIYEVFKGKN